ncbi:MAG: class I adenylate-forming enzyme family protein [Acidimicrobiales bacterium]
MAERRDGAPAPLAGNLTGGVEGAGGRPAQGDDSLAAVLLGHPMPDDEGLLLTVDRRVTAGQAKGWARSTAAALAEAGVAPGQAVGVCLPNCPEAITTMVGIWLAGAVFVPLNPRAAEPERRHMLATTGATALIGPDGLERLDGGRRYPAGTAFILWTSGTTGPPKPIVHTHHAYVELIDRVLSSLRSEDRRRSGRPPTPNLIPTSLALNSGIYNAIFGLRAGAALVIMSAFDPLVFAELVRRFEIRSTVLPPAAMVSLTDAAEVTDLTPLRYVRSITAPLSPLQGRRFAEKFGVAVLNSYGQAEIGEVIGWTAADARQHPEKLGAAGRPHSGVDLKVVDDAGTAVPGGEVGRLLVRPRRMAAGYAGDGALADRLDGEGFLDTGDLARIDPDGFVWIEGRAGDLINRGGNKVFPEQVEEVLRLSPSVAEAAVIAVPDDRLGEVPVALVVGTGGKLEADELERLCRQHLTPYKVPVAFEPVASLAYNEAGKLLRGELARRYLDRRGR